MADVSFKNERILTAIKDHYREHLCAPSLSWLKEHLQYKSVNSIVQHLKALTKANLVEALPSGGFIPVEFKDKLREALRCDVVA